MCYLHGQKQDLRKYSSTNLYFELSLSFEVVTAAGKDSTSQGPVALCIGFEGFWKSQALYPGI